MEFNLRSYVEQARRFGTDTQAVEVKTSREKLPKDVAETVSAFANTSGGHIILGLSEKDGFAPVEGFDARRIADALGHLCAERIEPPIRASIDLEEYDGATVVVAYIPELEPVRKPAYIKARTPYDGSFVRTGDGDRKLSRYEVDRLIEGGSQPTYDARIVPDATIADLDQELVDGLLARERANSPRVFGRLSDEDALLSLSVLTRDDEGIVRPTLAGLMALGTYPQHFFPRANVSFTVFPGETKGESVPFGSRYLDARTIEGSIPVMVSEALTSLRRNMRIGARVEGALRYDVPDYPEDAVREAVSNALMHRDYSPEGLASGVQVNLFSDRLEVINPGGLYGMVTVDNIGTYGTSASRNARLSRILESTPFAQGYAERGFVVENKGTGYAQMQATLKAAGMPPAEPVDEISLFCLTMRRRGIGAAAEQATPTGLEGLMADGVPRSTSQIAKALGISSATALRKLTELVNRGLLVRTGRGPAVRYELSS